MVTIFHSVWIFGVKWKLHKEIKGLNVVLSIADDILVASYMYAMYNKNLFALRVDISNISNIFDQSKMMEIGKPLGHLFIRILNALFEAEMYLVCNLSPK